MSNTTNFLSYNDAIAILSKIGNKINSLQDTYVFRGCVPYSALPDVPTKEMNGFVQNIMDDFVADSRFIQVGTPCPAGTCVAVATVNIDLEETYVYSIIKGFIDTSLYDTRITDVREMISDNVFSASKSYFEGSIVTYKDGLYRFKKNHSAGPQSMSDVEEVSMQDLITFISEIKQSKLLDTPIIIGAFRFDNVEDAINGILDYAKTKQPEILKTSLQIGGVQCLTVEQALYQLTKEAESTLNVDDQLSLTSINPVQNKIITAALDNKIEASDFPTTAELEAMQNSNS